MENYNIENKRKEEFFETIKNLTRIIVNKTMKMILIANMLRFELIASIDVHIPFILNQ